MYSLVQLTLPGLSTSLISATARLHTCLRGAIDQDLNQVSDFCSTQRLERIFDDHAYGEVRRNYNWKFRKEESGRKLICKRKVKLIGSQSIKITTNYYYRFKVIKKIQIKNKKIVGLDTRDKFIKRGNINN